MRMNYPPVSITTWLENSCHGCWRQRVIQFLGDIIWELFVELWMIPIFGAKTSKRTSTANPNLVWWDGALAVGTVDISIITAWSLFLDKIHLKPTAMPSVTSHRSPTGSSKRCQRFILFPNLPIGTVAENRHGHRVRWRKAPFLDEDEPQQWHIMTQNMVQ